MALYHNINNNFYNNKYINDDLDQLVMYYFYKLVHNKKNGNICFALLIYNYW